MKNWINTVKTANYFQQFELIYKKIKHMIVCLFIALMVILVISIAIGAIYFSTLTTESDKLEDSEIRQAVIDFPGMENIDTTNQSLLEAYNHSENPLIVGPKNVSPYVTKALISSEDSLYYSHNGILPKALFRAIYQDIFNTDYTSGGSTITQQLVKNQILTNEKTYDRKANEIMLALRLDRIMTKQEVLFTYLNIVPFGRDYNGNNITGISSASYSLFGKHTSQLNIAESAYLIGLLQSPYYYTPYEEDGRLKSDEAVETSIQRQHYVLKRMLVEGHITREEYKQAEKVDIKPRLMAHKPS